RRARRRRQRRLVEDPVERRRLGGVEPRGESRTLSGAAGRRRADPVRRRASELAQRLAGGRAAFGAARRGADRGAGAGACRMIRVLLVILLLATAADAAPDPTLPQDSHSLAGQLLVAAPGMQDPRFRETVILMVRHGPEGAFGLVINRPVEERPLSELMASGGLPSEGVEGSIRIFYGGPVPPASGLGLPRPHPGPPGTRARARRPAVS